MPKKVVNAKIACLDFSLQKAKMHLGVSVVVDDPEKLEAIRERYIHVFIYLLNFISTLILSYRVIFIRVGNNYNCIVS